jgi:hypothetical protein
MASSREELLSRRRARANAAYRHNKDGYRSKQLKMKYDRYHNDADHREAHRKACRERYHKKKAEQASA